MFLTFKPDMLLFIIRIVMFYVLKNKSEKFRTCDLIRKINLGEYRYFDKIPFLLINGINFKAFDWIVSCLNKYILSNILFPTKKETLN